jgi:hypothetical protein
MHFHPAFEAAMWHHVDAVMGLVDDEELSDAEQALAADLAHAYAAC